MGTEQGLKRFICPRKDLEVFGSETTNKIMCVYVCFCVCVNACQSIVLRAYHALTHSILIATLFDGYHYYPFFMEEENEA